MPHRPGPGEHNHWESGRMERALRLILYNGLKLPEAARRCEIPQSTLRDALARDDPFTTQRRGPKPALSFEEEKFLVEWILKSSRVGIHQSDFNIRNAVKYVLDTAGRKNVFKNFNLPAESWMVSFMGRHQELCERKPKVSSGKANVSWATINNWFSELDDHLREEGLNSVDFFSIANDDRTISIDETATTVNVSGNIGKFLVTKGQKAFIDRGPKHLVMTAVATCSASGHFFKPMIIFPSKSKRDVSWTSYPDLDDTEWHVGHTKNGWMDNRLFISLLQLLNEELIERGTQKPVLLLMDGLKSHVDLNAAEYAKKEGIILYAIPPHSSHLLQPLDVGVLTSLKSAYKESVEFFSESLGPCISKAKFPRVFMRAWHSAATSFNAKAGFNGTGIFPRNPSTIKKYLVKKDSRIPPAPPQPSRSYLLGKKTSSDRSLHIMESFLDVKLLEFFKKIKNENEELDDNIFHIWSCLYDQAHTNNLLFNRIIERDYGDGGFPLAGISIVKREVEEEDDVCTESQVAKSPPLLPAPSSRSTPASSTHPSDVSSPPLNPSSLSPTTPVLPLPVPNSNIFKFEDPDEPIPTSSSKSLTHISQPFTLQPSTLFFPIPDSIKLEEEINKKENEEEIVRKRLLNVEKEEHKRKKERKKSNFERKSKRKKIKKTVISIENTEQDNVQLQSEGSSEDELKHKSIVCTKSDFESKSRRKKIQKTVVSSEDTEDEVQLESEGSSEEELEYRCIICNESECEDDGKDEVVVWVQCEMCDAWAHKQCDDLNNLSKIQLETYTYICKNCK